MSTDPKRKPVRDIEQNIDKPEVIVPEVIVTVGPLPGFPKPGPSGAELAVPQPLVVEGEVVEQVVDAPVVDKPVKKSKPQSDSRLDWVRYFPWSEALLFGLVTGVGAFAAYVGYLIWQSLMSVFHVLYVAGAFVAGLGSTVGPVLGGGLVLGLVWVLARTVGGSIGSTASQPVSRSTAAQPVSKTEKPVSKVAKPAAASPDKPKAGGDASPKVRTLFGMTSTSKRPIDVPIEEVSDDSAEIIARGLARLRSKKSTQSVGMWQGGQYDLLADAMYGGSLETAVNMHGNDHCAADHLLEEIQHYDGPRGRNGRKHPAMDRAREVYGDKLLKDVIRMNDQGTSLRKIADYVERKTGK
jgi:hypothetical protein